MFVAGIAGIIACAELCQLLMPEAFGLLISIVVVLTVLVILIAFGADKRVRQKARDRNDGQI